jgi:hypothetical protein
MEFGASKSLATIGAGWAAAGGMALALAVANP